MKFLKHYRAWTAALGLLALASQPANAKPARKPANAPSYNYQQRIEELEQRQKILERNIELEEEKKQEKEKERAVVKAGSEGFALKSQDGNYQLKLRGAMQADARFYLDDSPKRPPHAFIIRRARPVIEGTLAKHFDFRTMIEFGEGRVTVLDAYVDTKIRPEFNIRVGKFKEPVGLERLQAVLQIAFVERGLTNELVPNRDLGVEIFGDIGKGSLFYELGVFNGVADGGSLDTDSNGEKDFAGRVFGYPFKKTSITPLKNLGLGVSGTYGKQEGTEAAPNLSPYRGPDQRSFFNFRNDGTPEGTTVANGIRYRISPQGYYYYGPFGLLGDFVLSSQRVKRANDQAELRNTAWNVQANYVLGGEPSFQGVHIKKPFRWKQGGYGALEFAGRYGELEIDSNTFPLFADGDKSARKVQAWGVGLNWHLNRNIKIMLSYDEAHFQGGAANGGDRPTEKSLFNRYQVLF